MPRTRPTNFKSGLVDAAVPPLEEDKMISFVKLSVGTAMAFALAACTTTTDDTTNDGGVAADTGVKTDTGTTTDSATDSAPTTDSGGDAGACTLAIPAGQAAACNECATNACCDTWNACFTDSACVALATCVGGCIANNGGDAAAPDGGTALDGCKQNCANADGVTEPTVTKFNDAVQCVVTNCTTTPDPDAGADAGVGACNQ
jgi:hypothetical protein